MGKRIGVGCILLGVLCLMSAVGLVVYNRWEAGNAETVSQDLLAQMQSVMDVSQQELPEEGIEAPEAAEKLPGEIPPGEMATVEVDGLDCIGILSVPALNLELPVLTDWSYAKLKKSPCHYYGTYYEPNFVIAAHNYDSHFGRLSQLQPGDVVVFTDVDGADRYYEVVLLETLPQEATLEMITSGFDLSLYTCTPGGASRVTVRCSRIPGV